ncbi:MAG: hypothetical protein ACLTMP_06585 [Eggerthella lenta]
MWIKERQREISPILASRQRAPSTTIDHETGGRASPCSLGTLGKGRRRQKPNKVCCLTSTRADVTYNHKRAKLVQPAR